MLDFVQSIGAGRRGLRGGGQAWFDNAQPRRVALHVLAYNLTRVMNIGHPAADGFQSRKIARLGRVARFKPLLAKRFETTKTQNGHTNSAN